MSIRAINWAVEVSIRIGIPANKRLTLWAIAHHHYDKTGECYPSYETIARQAGCSRRKAIYDVQEFEFNGLLVRQKRSNGDGLTSNNYLLFGRPKFGRWKPLVVQGGAPRVVQQRAPRETPGVVQQSAPDRDWLYNTRGPCEVVTFEPFPAKKEIVSSGTGGGAA